MERKVESSEKVTKPMEAEKELTREELLDAIRQESEKGKLKKEFAFMKQKYDTVLKELDVKQSLLDAVEVSQMSDDWYTIKTEWKKSDKKESTAVLMASDWHLEETVKPEMIWNLNAYNLKIAEKRANDFWTNSVKMMDGLEYDTNIKNVVVWLWWDFISGYIHEELVEWNSLSPTEAIIMAKQLLEAWIKYLLENTDKDITIVCNFWNHGRTTDKSRISTWYANNYEWLMYNMIADKFSENDRVKFKIDKGYSTILKVYDKKIRFHHWDWIKYNGWVGWLYIPVNKAIAQWNKGNKVDIDVMWHYHQMTDGWNFLVNGSLIWYWPYAERIKWSYERPQQVMFLLNEKYWKTITAPIIVNEWEKRWPKK